VGVNSKTVTNAYLDLIEKVGNEFKILLDATLNEIENNSSSLLRNAISKMRSGNIYIAPGYDGEFGKVRIFEEVKKKKSK
jgi:PHP family Zn ribbon phosphoesterase